jgi:SAM-dependent methyltransferase
MYARDLYDDSYAAIYRALYIDHPQWRDKHSCNVAIVRSLVSRQSSWLDTFCGQAWHFSQVGEVERRIGVDVSAAQLRAARHANPEAVFIEADVLAVDAGDLGGDGFDLVTCFWGSLSYLDGPGAIAAFLGRAAAWTAPGGSLYLELITPATLEAFNQSGFAAETGSRTGAGGAGEWAWSYDDPGGRHEMVSPPLGFFRERLAPWFEQVELRAMVATMQQLVATGRRAGEGAPAHE